MQSKCIEATKGFVLLDNIQNNKLKLLSTEEIKNSDLPDINKEIIFYVAKKNNFQKIPPQREIRKIFGLRECTDLFISLEKKRLLFRVTIPEIVCFYGLDYLGFNRNHFYPPSHLKWLNNYLGMSYASHCAGMPWPERIKPENSTSRTYDRHLIAPLKDEKTGLPCYLPLNFHIPK